MEERLRFVVRLLEGEAMSDLAREFGISHKTGYKILNRYREHGLEALTDRSRRPWRYANTGARARSASCWSSASPAMCASPPEALFMPCSTAMAL
jgi:transposase